ncbi:two-component-system connector protein AriR, partial [Enterobacter hormaechei]
MRQNIQLQPEYHSAFLDSALSEYFRHAGDRFAEES